MKQIRRTVAIFKRQRQNWEIALGIGGPEQMFPGWLQRQDQFIRRAGTERRTTQGKYADDDETERETGDEISP